LQFANRESRIDREDMKKHNGMRPQDVVILLKIASTQKNSWMAKDIATDLHISNSEVSESLNRSKMAGLLDSSKKKLMNQAFLEFVEHGLKYVFPAIPGSIVRGMPTAHSALPLENLIQSSEDFVWPDARGISRGQSIEPLHPGVVQAAKKDNLLYGLLALTDAIRVGKSREKKLAFDEIKKRIG